MKLTVRRALRISWIICLGFSLAGWVVLAIFGTSEVGADGVLHEPLFGLIPISSFLMLIAIVLALGDLILSWRKKS
jgi:hypothetical protein